MAGRGFHHRLRGFRLGQLDAGASARGGDDQEQPPEAFALVVLGRVGLRDRARRDRAVADLHRSVPGGDDGLGTRYSVTGTVANSPSASENLNVSLSSVGGLTANSLTPVSSLLAPGVSTNFTGDLATGVAVLCRSQA